MERLVDDLIILDSLEVECIIGIFDWERETRQTVAIDFELACDMQKAAASDDISDAVDYKIITKEIIALVEPSKFRLIEKMADEIARLCLSHSGVKRATITVSKPGAVRGSKNISVRISRPVSDFKMYLGVGGNIEPEKNIEAGLKLLRERFDVTKTSSVYRSPAWGVKEKQPDYLNLAVEVFTDKDIFSVRAELRWIEELLGRARTLDKFSPRTLDIDLLLYGEKIADDGYGKLPHPQLLTQPFVYVPMVEIAPELLVPGVRKALKDCEPVYDDPSIEVVKVD